MAIQQFELTNYDAKFYFNCRHLIKNLKLPDYLIFFHIQTEIDGIIFLILIIIKVCRLRGLLWLSPHHRHPSLPTIALGKPSIKQS